MPYPSLINYRAEAEYRLHFERVYCKGTIEIFDGISVRFRKNMFNHCFFESSRRDKNKDLFSIKRAERIDWIKAALLDSKSGRYIGWDGNRKSYSKSRRVTIVMENYVVVIQLIGEKKANFVTAYMADIKGRDGGFSTIEKIRRGPKWA
ncbi:MAG: hypothetical protein ACUZ8O_15925 [Candidatus Anammoxibacter sp.]